MSELIEKQKVLDALREIATEKFSLDDPYGVYINVLMDVEEKICRLPVVQPNGPDNLVKDSQGLAKDLVNDTISRRAAIDATWFEPSYTDPLNVLTEVRDRLKALPSAQSEDVQKIQDLEQAQFDKIRELAYQDGKADAMAKIIHCKDCYYRYGRYCHYRYTNGLFITEDHYCGFAKRQEDNK